jgi:hypothetical protein
MPNNKQKGGRVELKIAKLLTQITGTQFHRVGVCSGSRFTSANIRAVGFYGDVFTEDEKYKYLCIEVKATKKIVSITDIFNEKSLLSSYILQCMRESPLDWILIVVVNGRQPFFLCQYETFLPQKDSDVVDSHKIVEKYADIFKNSKVIEIGDYMIGILK